LSFPRFDTGQQLCWLPLGVYPAGQNLGASELTLVDLNPSGGIYYRIDYASLTLRWLNILDLEIWAEMVITTGAGTNVPMLSLSQWYAATDLELPLNQGQDITAQLSLPFYVNAETTISIRGGSGGTTSGNYAGIVAVSYAYAFLP
jgi:hypothetical protein